MPDVGLGTERVWRGRARCESGGGGEIEITRGGSEEAGKTMEEKSKPHVSSGPDIDFDPKNYFVADMLNKK